MGIVQSRLSLLSREQLPARSELLCGVRVVLCVKDDFGLPELVPDLPVLGDRRGAEA
jgi:hypothetical protein